MVVVTAAERDNYLRWNGRRAGVYEVYYLKFNDPQTRAGFWLRYTLTSPKEGPARAELWGIVFDPAAPHPVAFKSSHPIWQVGLHDEHFRFRIDTAELTHSSARGAISSAAGELSWNLAWQPWASSVHHFGYDWMYQAPWPKTKVLTPNPLIRLVGTVTCNGKVYELRDVPGQQGHIWGNTHAERWAWGHCAAFAEDPDAIFEGLTANPEGTRQFSSFFVRSGGRELALNKLPTLLWGESAYTFDRWNFAAEGEGYRIRGQLSAPAERFVGVTYTGPGGDTRICTNSTIADCFLEVERKASGGWELVSKLSSLGMAAMETGAREAVPGVPVRL